MKKANDKGFSHPGVSVYQRGKKWAYLVYCEPDILTKKRDRVYKGGYETEGEAFAAGVLAKSEADQKRQPKRKSNVTVAQFFTDWLESMDGSVKPSTFANYVDNTNAYIIPVLGHHKLAELATPVLNAFYKHLATEGRVKPDNNTKMYRYWEPRQEERGGLGPRPTEIARACGTGYHAAKAAVLRYRQGRVPKKLTAGLAPKSVRNVHRLIRRAMDDAIGWGHIAANPAAAARLPRVSTQDKKGRNRPIPWTVDELAAWLKVAVTDRFGALWILAATTGMRRSELAGICREGLDLDAGTLVIDDTRIVVDGKATDSDGKTEAGERTISLDAFTVNALRLYLAMIDAEREQFGATYPTHGKLIVFPDGTCPHPDTITRTFNRLVDRAKVRKIRLHDVRHTYVTLSRDHGANGKILADRVGHASEVVTNQVYSHRTKGHDREIAEDMAGLITERLRGVTRVTLKSVA